MCPDANETEEIACFVVDPGVCGFHATIKAQKIGRRVVKVKILGSQCKQIQHLSKRLGKILLKDVFQPITRNPVYIAAEKAGCHGSCVVPVAVIKAAEVALHMALPRDASIKSQKQTSVGTNVDEDERYEDFQCGAVQKPCRHIA